MSINKAVLYFLLMSGVCLSCSEKMDENRSDLLEQLMQREPEKFSNILENRDELEVQIIYTRIDRDSLNRPSFSTFEFNTDPKRYFYPASTVKMPVAILALEKINDIGLDQLTRNTAMLTDSAYSGQSEILIDSTAENNLPSIAHYIREIFVVSDNEAFNRLYEFVGPGEIRSKLRSKGFDDARIIHRLSIALSEDENRHTNPIRFTQGDTAVYSQPEAFGIKKGKGYLKGDSIVNEPMEFGTKNFIPLDELTGMLQRVIFPEYFDASQRFNLKADDYAFIRKCMSQLPAETIYPTYPSDEYFDAYSKFLMFGSDSSVVIPEHIRIFNKIGLAYGYTTDVAYVVDFKNNIEFMLSATIHTNKNKIYNDGIYEYEEVSFPFMRDLGEMIYTFELGRSRQYQPDLSAFRLTYDQPR